MCGITAIVRLTDQQIHLPQVIQKMTDAIRHRGPDDEGYVLFNKQEQCCAGGKDTQLTAWNTSFPYSPKKDIKELSDDYTLAIGHRRLSVIDLSEAAHQPMCMDEVWITLNGEIYNYIELRNELTALGYQFKSQSDTEVLLKAYQEWGIDCLQKLNGMWSFVIYDKARELLFGSRDRFGVKPLYYYKDEQVLAFASEHKALLQIPNNKIGINESAVFDFLFLSQIEMGIESFFKNVFELMPSHYFIYDFKLKSFTIDRYYELSFNHNIEAFDAHKQLEYTRQTRKLIHKAIDIRLRADIPVGFCLSGGIDSSSIVCMASEISKEHHLTQLGDHLKTFTAVNKTDEYNEAHWAEMVVNQTGTDWIKAHCTAEDMMQELEKIIYHQDIPLLHSSTYAQYKVMQAAATNGIHILIDGQGGDELFAGYPPFYSAHYSDLICKLKWKTLLAEFKNIDKSPTSLAIYGRSLVKYGLDKILPEKARLQLAKLIKPEAKYLNADFVASNTANISFAGEYQLIGCNPLLHHYFANHYLKNLLRWEDRCSMTFAVESRTPFSDDIALIEYIFSISSTYKIKNGWSKSLLRNAMQGILPDAIKNRTDKMGFSTPQQLWLHEINHEMKAKITALHHTDHFVNAERLLNDWDAIFSGNDTKAQDFAWRYMNYLIWKEIFGK
ncbi:MAG: asparagine synthase (glutamine-hydrolyzing) [Bacteroidetes bacterium]|nr:asparagine synthase (glutamine-hydrolyzing) [Bacteroidota bacterium]